jgi:NarL family two-component system response regulator LiaR
MEGLAFIGIYPSFIYRGRSFFFHSVNGTFFLLPVKWNPLSLLEELTKRELDVFLKKLPKEKAIKKELPHYSSQKKTVKTHVSNLLAKLELTDRTQATLFAFKNQLVN